MNRAVLVFLAIGAVAMTGCGTGDPPQPNSGLQRYGSAQEMSDELAASGNPCDRIEENPTAIYPVESVICYIDGIRYNLSIYLSDKDRDKQVEIIQSDKAFGGTHGVIAGANWTVSCGNPDRCAVMRQVFGGKVRAAWGN